MPNKSQKEAVESPSASAGGASTSVVPRYLPDVLQRICDLIPAPYRDTLAKDFVYLRGCALYTAPEDMRRHWDTGAKLLEHYFPNGPEADWQKKLIEIWMGKENESPYYDGKLPEPPSMQGGNEAEAREPQKIPEEVTSVLPAREASTSMCAMKVEDVEAIRQKLKAIKARRSLEMCQDFSDETPEEALAREALSLLPNAPTTAPKEEK